MTRESAQRALPLSDIVVVSIEQAVAAPFASRQLADLGARVIKIERPDGGDFARDYDRSVNGLASYFFWLNRGKESVTADLKDPVDRQFVRELIAHADVFIQNLGPGAAGRMGLAGAQLCAQHDRLVACDVSGYGEGGPYGERKAYDLLIQCEAGLVSVTGSPDSPAKAGISVADISAGMYAYSGILSALYERERTGAGSHLAVSLFDSLAEWMGAPTYFGHYSGTDPRRTGAAHATIAPYGPFATADGKQVNIGIQNARDWVRLCADVLDAPELLADPRYDTNANRVANRQAMETSLSQILSGRPLGELVAALAAAGIAFGVMRGAGELLDHPQLTTRDRLRTVGSPVGDLQALLPPVIWEGHEAQMGDVPALGEHSDAVRRWLHDTAGAVQDD
jgi:itaconate CoA-transferase